MSPITRRRFLTTAGTVGASAAAGAAATAAALGGLPRPGQPAEPTPAPRATATAAPAAQLATPPLALIALNRLAYGPRQGDLAAFAQLGPTPEAQLAAYLEQQLRPEQIDDSACEAKLASVRLRLRYDAMTDPTTNTRYPARDEALPLETLAQPLGALWPRAQGRAPFNPWPERVRPSDEVRVATWLRAIYSQRQLQAVMAEFWHDHFSVNAYSHPAIAATFPLYDAMIRRHCFGSFRVLLGDVAKSPAMMYALNNVSNKAGGGEGGNENYARELFELHTLGAEHYLTLYDDRASVGTLEYDGRSYPRGYIDRDVYEAARCLSGWTIGNGKWEQPQPDDGAFSFFSPWHDNALKIVLGQEFPYNQGVADGERVLDLLAEHPGTARHLCAKLCRRLVADEPPAALVEAAVAAWMRHRSAPDQLAHVLRAIVLSDAFAATWGQKNKRPFEFTASYLRAIDAELPSDEVAADPNVGNRWDAFFRYTSATGHKIFEWPFPTGHPDVASYWANTNSLLWRWNLPSVLVQPWGGGVQVDLLAQTSRDMPGASCVEIVRYWVERLRGYPLPPETRSALVDFMAQRAAGGDPTQSPQPMNGEPDDASIIAERLGSLAQLIAMTPEFQMR